MNEEIFRWIIAMAVVLTTISFIALFFVGAAMYRTVRSVERHMALLIKSKDPVLRIQMVGQYTDRT